MLETTLTVDNFEAEVLNQEGYVLVDFWATWCGPCKMIAPIVAEIAEENQGTIKVGKVDVDQQMPLAQKYRVASIPTLILFKDGQPVQQSIGFSTKEEIEKLIRDFAQIVQGRGGLEVYYEIYLNQPEKMTFLKEMQEKYQLLPSVSSDRHRTDEPFASGGTYPLYQAMLGRCRLFRK